VKLADDVLHCHVDFAPEEAVGGTRLFCYIPVERVTQLVFSPLSDLETTIPALSAELYHFTHMKINNANTDIECALVARLLALNVSSADDISPSSSASFPPSNASPSPSSEIPFYSLELSTFR
jgi:hypothetical protein